MVTGCVSSRLVHRCEGEGECGFYGLPHVLCVPVPPYARAVARADTAAPSTGLEEAAPAPFGPVPALHVDG